MSLRTTAILNLKGGVAKSTTAINMAAILAGQNDHRVLIIDADSQCNTTEFFGARKSSGTLADLLRIRHHAMDRVEAALYITTTAYPRIHIISGDDSLMDLDLSKIEQGAANAAILRDLIGCVKNDYDYCIIDCPPAFNAACAAALVAADDVVIPIKVDAFALRGMANLMRQVQNIRKINPSLRVCGLLPTMWYKSQDVTDAIGQLRQSGFRIFRPIRRSNKVDGMTFAQEPLTKFSPRSAAGMDYRAFVAEYMRG